jgi:hypothetical protein
MDGVEKKFNELATAWEEHCDEVSFSSNTAHYLNHASYRELVKLGRPAIPFIMERYRKGGPHGVGNAFWEFLLDDITGLNMIGDRGDFNRVVVREKYLKWWQMEQREH